MSCVGPTESKIMPDHNKFPANPICLPACLRWVFCALWLLAGLMVATSSVHAEDEFIIQDIRVEGLDRMTAGTVFNALPLTVGDRYTEERAQAAVRDLFKTGLFRDVRLEREGEVLVVVIDERESISDIEFTGNEDIPTESLLDALSDLGIAKGEVFNESKLDRVVQELRRQYYAQGKYGVVIESEAVPVARKLVKVEVRVTEGQAARIKDINIVGNQAFPEDELLDLFQLTTPGWLTWFTKRDQYSKQKLSGDLESLQSFYQDSGFARFEILSTQVSVTPDKADVYITININEGPRYTISEVTLQGELIVPEDALFKVVTVHKGDLFSRKAITQTSDNISERLGVDGYAFANVNAIPDIDPVNNTVSLDFFVDPGQRTYVRRIIFNGNTKTRDEVLRREMRQLEGGWISTAAVERSKVRLQRLGYFEEVNVETPSVPGTADQVDVRYSVTEAPNGSLMFGVGFSQNQGIILNASVAQRNFLGSGKNISFTFNNSEVNRTFALGYVNPYFTVDGVSRGFNARYQRTNAINANITAYDSEVYAFGVNFGVPITEYNTITFGLDYEDTKLITGGFASEQVNQFIATEGDQFNTLRVSSAFSYDTRNAAIFPTSGMLHRIQAQIATPPLDLNYYKVEYDGRFFFNIFKKYVLLAKGNVGYGDGFAGTGDLPFFENFYSGGPRSVRGYEENTLGPKDNFGRALGGNLVTTGNLEFILPVPFLEQLNSVRLTGFVDGGNVYGEGESFDFETFRYSAGVSGVWLSPFGILSVSLAQPFESKSGDRTQPFQFNFGTSF